MKVRFSLSARILLLALLNLVLLVGAFVFVAQVYYDVGLRSLLMAPARDRVATVAREVAIDLQSTEPDQRTGLMGRFAAVYGADFYLFRNNGEQLGGRPVTLPSAVRAELVRGQRGRGEGRMEDGKGPPPERRPPPPEDEPFPPPPPAEGFGPPEGRRPPPSREGRPPRPKGKAKMPGGEVGGGVFLLHADDLQWAGIRIPIADPEEDVPIRGTLLIAAKSFYGTPLFFDFKPWLVGLVTATGIFILCWLPFIRGLTRSISRLNEATGRISQGNFEIHLRDDRTDELGALASSINRLTERLSGFVSGQKRFLGDIAHELCAPIARIQFGLGILDQRVEEEHRAAVADVEDEVRQMSTLVSELMSFSKAGMEAAKRPLTAVDAATVARRAVERENTGVADIRVDVAEGISAMADEMMLVRAISNVVRNAMRYAGQDGPIVVSAKQHGASVSIFVRDSGPGLAPEDLDRVFTPFYRPEASRNRSTGGAGLGLAIVRSCIEVCQGTVEARNRESGGLEVEFRLQAATEVWQVEP